MAAGSIVIDLLMRTGSFETDTKRAQKRLKEFEGTIGKATTVVASFAAAFGGIAFNSFIRNTMDAEKEQAQLGAVLMSTAEAAGFGKKSLNDMADAMSQMATVSSGEINDAQIALLAFTGIAGNQFTQALQSAIDMAARTGMSVVSAAETIGRALDIPSKGLSALSRQGFRFTEDQQKLVEQLEATGKTAEAQGIVLSALQESYGGAAQAARDTFGGSLAGLKNTLNDLMTGKDGSLNGATDSINQLTVTLQSAETQAAFASFVEMIAKATTSFAQFMETISKGEFWGWAITSGDEAKNASMDIAKLTDSLDKLRTTKEAFLDSAAPQWFIADDLKILDVQIKSTQEKINYLKSIESRNAIKVTTPNIPFIDLTAKPIDSKQPVLSSSKTSVTNTESQKFLSEMQKQAQAYSSFINQITGRTDIAVKEQEQEWLRFAQSVGDITTQEFESAMASLSKVESQMNEFTIQAARNIQNILGDGLYNVLSGRFSDIGASFGDMIKRMAADLMASQVAKLLFGDFGTNGDIGGIVAKIGGAIASSFVGGGPSLSPAYGEMTYLSEGGYTGAGGKYEPAGVVHRGEYVLNAKSTKKLGVGFLDRLNNGYANGGYVGNANAGMSGAINVNIKNEAGADGYKATAQAKTNSDGGLNIDVLVRRVVSSDISSNGLLAQQMANTFGLQRAI